jgi:acyl-CoA thioester hydrolase
MMRRSDFRFFHPLRVRYSEIDAQSVVYNSHYVTYFDIAITELMRATSFDYSMSQAQRTGKDFYAVKVIVEFLASAYYDDELEIGVRPGRIGRSSINWELAVFRQDADPSLAEGQVTWVYTQMNANKSTPLPKDLVAELRSDRFSVPLAGQDRRHEA